MLTLQESTDLCGVLADASRQRLLLLLEAHALSAAELTEVTGLAQSRVSTHLSRLRRAGLVHAEKSEGAALYSSAPLEGPAAGIWQALRQQLDDTQARADLEQAAQVLRARGAGQTWAESVAGRMERHYSPGRTWEATAHALMGVVHLGAVIDLASGDGVFAELIASQVKSVTCVDVSATVLAAARRRLAGVKNVQFQEGDMHALPFAGASFDTAFALHALSYSGNPAAVLGEARRVLKKGGLLVVSALAEHKHSESIRSYDHRNLGFKAETLGKMLKTTHFRVQRCGITSVESRPPYFEVITAVAEAV